MHLHPVYAKVTRVILMGKKLQSSALLLLATIIWGSAFVSQSVAMDHMGPFTFQALRCFLGFSILIPVIAVFDHYKKDGRTFFQRWLDWKLWKAGLLCGIPLFLACNLQQVGLVETDAGKSGFLTAMYIVFVPVIGIFRKEKTTIMIPISVVLAAVGLYCLSCAGVSSISTGDLLTICCAVMFAVQIICIDLFASSVDPLRLNAIQALVCTVLSSTVMAFTETPTWSGILVCIPQLAHVGFLSMGIAYSLQILAQKNLAPSTASIIMSMESVFAVILGAWILKETMTGWEILGCVLVFAAIILSQITIPSKAKRT